MKTVNELMRDAFAALLRGDTAERDRLCALAMNALNAVDRVHAGGPLMLGEPILLPDRSEEKP
jgi:hypothetical protein